MEKKSSNRLNFIVAMGLAAVLLWLFFKDADWPAIGQAIVHANIWLLVLAYSLQLLSTVLKAWRWRMFLNPVQQGISIHTCWKYFNIGFAATTLLPLRAGEVIRPYLLSREKNISFTASLATIVTERIFDLVFILLMFSTIFIFPEVAGPNPGDDNVSMLKSAGLIMLAVSVVAVAFLTMLRVKPGWARAVVGFFCKPLPKGLAEKILGLVDNFAQGVGSLSSLASMGGILLLSLVSWALGAGFFWLTFQAFGFDLPYIFFLFMQAAAALGVAIPTPAGSGGYHGAMLLVAVSLWGLPQAGTQAIALASHIIIFGSMTLIGVAYLLKGDINIFSAAGKAQQQAEAQE